jgi:shikimate dehydrogenase
VIRGAVLGADVSKSRSPVIHEAAVRALGVSGRYEAMSVEARGFRALVRRLAAEGYAYVNVTIPHKRAAAAAATRRSPLVEATGAANTLVFGRSRPAGAPRTIRADNTDGYGLLTALADLSVDALRGEMVVMVGAGGAAAGGLAALLRAGARVRVVARRPAAARALRARFPEATRRRIEIGAWTGPALARALEGAEVLVSAVPAAAWAGAEAAEGLAALARGAAVLEMAYGSPSALQAAVRGRTSRFQDGIPMLVHQAAKAVELALGELPPAAPLLRAARRSLARQS